MVFPDSKEIHCLNLHLLNDRGITSKNLEWKSFRINRRVIKINRGKPIQFLKEYNFGSVKWPRISLCKPNRNFLYITGGLSGITNRVFDQCLEVNLDSRSVITRNKMPEPRFAHAAIILNETLYVTGGIPDMMHSMGMRSVPIGSETCFKYNLLTTKWSSDIPELPIGKLYPTLISIENRYIF